MTVLSTKMQTYCRNWNTYIPWSLLPWQFVKTVTKHLANQFDTDTVEAWSLLKDPPMYRLSWRRVVT